MEIEIERTGWVAYTLVLGKHEGGDVAMNMTWNILALSSILGKRSEK